MALTLQQQRRRNMILTVIAVFAVLGGLFGKTLYQAVSGAQPGYLSHDPTGQYTQLDWKVAQQGQWEYGKKPIVPGDITALNGHRVCVKGFLLPLHNPGESAQFFIAPKPRGCYYCNPPGVSEVVQINVHDGKELPFTDWRVHAYGTFKVATGAAGDTVLYELDDAQLEVSSK